MATKWGNFECGLGYKTDKPSFVYRNPKTKVGKTLLTADTFKDLSLQFIDYWKANKDNRSNPISQLDSKYFNYIKASIAKMKDRDRPTKTEESKEISPMTNEQKQKFKQLLKPIVMEIRQQLKEQNKNLYTASMPTPDGPLGGYVKYNDYSKKFEVGTDDDFVGRFDKENDAVEELKSMGFKNIKKESVNRLKEEVYNPRTESNKPVKYLSKQDGQRLGLDDFPSFSATGSVSGMKKQYYGKGALLVKCGPYIYHVSSQPKIYFDEASDRPY